MHLDKVNAFEERCKRFGDWADGVERRIGSGGGGGGGADQVSGWTSVQCVTDIRHTSTCDH